MGETWHDRDVSRQGCGASGVQTNKNIIKENDTGQRVGTERSASLIWFVQTRAGGAGEAGAASVVLSYLRVDLKDIALCREKRRESCELRLDGQA